jgi:hypothetical protein
MVPSGVFLQELHEPTISKALAKANKVAESSQETPPPPDNITKSPIHDISQDRALPEDKVERKRLRRRAGQYTRFNDELYRRGANGTLM